MLGNTKQYIFFAEQGIQNTHIMIYVVYNIRNL